jgi:hypothetical protein
MADVARLISDRSGPDGPHPATGPSRRPGRARGSHQRRTRRRAAGLRRRRSAVLAASVFETIEAAHPRRREPSGAFSREEFWKHSIAVACMPPNCWPRRRRKKAARPAGFSPGRGVCLRPAARHRQGGAGRGAAQELSPRSSRRPICCAATSPIWNAPSSAWITWSSASAWPSAGELPRRCCARRSGCTASFAAALPAGFQTRAGQSDHAGRPDRARAAPGLQRQLRDRRHTPRAN